MIDTLRFRIPINENIYRAIRKRSTEIRKFNYAENREIFRVSTSDLKLGSYDRKINIYLPDETELFLEFSAPKFAFGHNVFLLYPEDIKSVLASIQSLLERKFTVFPEVSEWQVYRIDLCYAWKFRSELEAQAIIDVLRSFDFPRKKKSTYGTSVMFVGASYSLKFYLKHDEFYKHDFRYLRDNGHLDFAYRMLEASKGVLRFEVTLRKKYLNTLFSDKLKIADIPSGWYSAKLVDFFTKTMGGFDLKYMKKREVKKRLTYFYGKKKGGRLYMFYTFIKTEGKSAVDFYSASGFYKNLQLIREANVPLSFDELKDIEDFSLSIPDERVVNKQNSAGAAAPQILPSP